MKWSANHIVFSISLVFASLLNSNHTHGQQRVQFTQYMFNPLILNPAYAGAEGPLCVNLINRKQWTGIENAPSTQTFSAHSLFRREQVGLGISIVNDKIGVHSNLSVMTNYAYHLKIRKDLTLSMGLQGGLYKVSSDYVSLMNSSTNDPKLSSAPLRETFFEFGFGFYLRAQRLTLGLSSPEALPKTISVNDTTSIKLSKGNSFLLTRYRLTLNESIDLEPGVLVKYMPDLDLSYDININMIYRKVLTTGLSYRKKESVDFLLKAQVNPQLQFGYAYDHPIGAISRISNGSHEVMIQYLFRFVNKNVASPR
jgi:type IX secretion system PorP/SprF family membrane protein